MNNWWDNQTILNWLGITVAIIGTIATLLSLFPTEKLGNTLRRFFVNLKNFIGSNGVVFFSVISLSIIIYFIVSNQITLFFIACIVFQLTIILIQRRRKFLSPLTASCKTGNIDSENGTRGLRIVPWDDGQTVREMVDNEYVRRTNWKEKQGYIYFAIDPLIINNLKGRDVYIIVEYKDNSKCGDFELQYDSLDKSHPNPRFKSAGAWKFSNTDKWKVATWRIQDAGFNKGQQGIADFRLRCGKCSSLENATGTPEIFDIYIRSVTLVTCD